MLRKRGFTLVEVLVVIAVIGVLTAVVITAINPIEQANKARDARVKTGAVQLLSAIERYYAIHGDYPWVAQGDVADNNDPFGFTTASDPAVGVCGDSSCGTPGILIDSLELRDEFRNNDFIENGDGADNQLKVFIGTESSITTSVYACFYPKANSTKANAVNEDSAFAISPGNPNRDASVCSGTWDDSCYYCFSQ